VSIALDEHSRPSIAYFDGTAGDLRFAHFDGQQWNVQTVDARGSVGLYPSLAFDKNDHAIVSYFRKTSGDLRVARFDGTTWHVETVDLINTVGRSSDIEVDRKTGEIAVAYEDSTHGWLKVARNAGRGWTAAVVDKTTFGVTYTSVAFDRFDRPAISYYDIFHADLKFAELQNNTWMPQRLASKGAQGLYDQLYFTDDGRANILYYNRRNNSVIKISQTNAGGWTASTLQFNGGRYITVAVNPLDNSATYSWFQPGLAKLRLADV
jgi:hypothetical protein